MCGTESWDVGTRWRSKGNIRLYKKEYSDMGTFFIDAGFNTQEKTLESSAWNLLEWLLVTWESYSSGLVQRLSESRTARIAIEASKRRDQKAHSSGHVRVRILHWLEYSPVHYIFCERTQAFNLPNQWGMGWWEEG